jgi:chromate transporter
VPLAEALFLGIKATVIVIVAQALLRVSAKALKGPLAWASPRCVPRAFRPPIALPADRDRRGLIGYLAATPSGAPTPAPRVPLAQTGRTVAIWGAIWLLPLAVLWVVAPGGLLAEVGLFFAKLAVVTFGGAYAVLAWMVQEVVQDFGWLTTAQMMDALGLAETTPGPLILVTEFVGFLAGAQAGGLGPGPRRSRRHALGDLRALFPVDLRRCALRGMDRHAPAPAGRARRDHGGRGGVIANLSLWFALHVVFGEVTRTGVPAAPACGCPRPRASTSAR